MPRALACLALVCLLLCSACAPFNKVAQDYLRLPQDAAPTAVFAGAKVDPAAENWTFADIRFVMPDVDKLIRRADTLLARVQAGKNLEKQLKNFESLSRAYESAYSMCAYAYIRYCQNMAEEIWQERYIELSDQLNELNYRLVDIAVALIAAEQSGALTLPWSAARKQAFVREDGLNAPSVIEDMRQELKLVATYDKLGSGLTVSFEGRDWSYAQITEETQLPYGEYAALCDLYDGEYAQRAAALFLELMALRGGMAEKLGYESYTAYRYDCYRRDYTPEDITALCAAVKTHLVPLYRTYTVKFSNDLYYLYGASFSQAHSLARIQTAITQTAPELAEAWGYMRQHELYDLNLDTGKLGGSYTIYLSDYHAPFLYSHWDDSATIVGTVIHEFGHFANNYYNPRFGVNAGESLDLCEVDSQGFEMLMMGTYDTIFNRHAGAAQINELLDALYSVIAGCMEDEFQQRVYAAKDITAAEMNRIYQELAAEYGLAELYGIEGTSWTHIPHHFRSPLYYISYAASMLAALQIWELAQQDRADATAAYLNILKREPYAAFRETLAKNGLGTPMRPESVAELAETLTNYFNIQELYG